MPTTNPSPGQQILQVGPTAPSATAPVRVDAVPEDVPPVPVAGAGVPDGSQAVDAPTPPVSRAMRIPEGSLLGGVCTGLAAHLGLSVLLVRVGFVALTLYAFIGALVYGALWLLMPPQTPSSAPGLESASRSGMRAPTRRRHGVDAGMFAALMVLGGGLLWLVQGSGLGVQQQLFWPIAFACTGAALMWRQADTAHRKEWRAEAGGHAWLAPFLARTGWPALVRVVLGLGLLGAAFGLVMAQRGTIGLLPEVVAMTLLAVAGLLVVLAPWLHRSRTAMQVARAEKVRADARADMAAHLHDSVLQTLALIQRQAEDPRVVQQLARRQERELRSWLYGEQAPTLTLKTALAAAAADVEDEHGVPVELVVVGDCETSQAVTALVAAAREAMVNAAKHSRAAKVDVFCEVADDVIEAFVRDRGRGFDVSAVQRDRMGVRRSIVERMTRHGGVATIRSRPGDGTEVRLEISR